VKALVQRYLIATLGFAAAAVWLGVGLTRALECLLVFLLTSLVAGVRQRRQLVIERGHKRGRRRAVPEVRDRRQSRHSGSHSRPSRALYDDEADSGDRPRLAERHW
jgi:hypothetical protein